MNQYVQQLDGRTTDKRQEILRAAQEMFGQSKDWVSFFRGVFGVSGVVRRAFPSAEELDAFEETEEYFKIQAMLAELRRDGAAVDEGEEPTRVITVRLPKSLHESLRVEAHDRHTSMNKLCISKLLQIVNDKLIPDDGRTVKPAETVTAMM